MLLGINPRAIHPRRHWSHGALIQRGIDTTWDWPLVVFIPKEYYPRAICFIPGGFIPGCASDAMFPGYAMWNKCLYRPIPPFKNNPGEAGYKASIYIQLGIVHNESSINAFQAGWPKGALGLHSNTLLPYSGLCQGKMGKHRPTGYQGTCNINLEENKLKLNYKYYNCMTDWRSTSSTGLRRLHFRSCSLPTESPPPHWHTLTL